MDGRFGIEIDTTGAGDPLIVLSGEVDLAGAADIWTALEPVLDGAGRVVVDLSAVKFMDSTGLSVLVRAHRRLMHNGGQLVVRHPSEMAARLLDVTGLDGLFGTEPPAPPR